MKRYELTKEQWERVKAVLPPERTGKRGRPRKDDRKMLNGMLWIARSGAQWRELPEAYGPWQSVYARFAKWRDDGTLEAIFHALSADADMENLSLDSTCIKVHESANGGEKTANKAVGRTSGGDMFACATYCTLSKPRTPAGFTGGSPFSICSE